MADRVDTTNPIDGSWILHDSIDLPRHLEPADDE
jgi:hypothetical protein